MAKNFKRIGLLFAFAFALSGCVMPPPRPPLHADPSNPLKRVALLPLKNDTTDVDGPNVVRQKMAEALKQRSYVVQEFKETDQILRDQMGITLGGQLDMTTAQKLGDALGVEGVLYGTLMDFDETTTGLINIKKVRGKFRLVNAQTGQAVWSRGLGVRGEVKMSGVAGAVASTVSKAVDARDKEVPWVTIENKTTGNDNLGKSLVLGLGSKLVSKAMGKHLDHESTELARRITDSLPWGPGEYTASAPPRPAPVAIELPAVKAPEPPSFGHMDFGKRDFTAVMISTMVNKADNQPMIMEALLAKSGEKFRTDMDMAKLAKGQGMPPELSRMIVITRGDRRLVYTLYPDKRRYIVHPEEEDIRGQNPKIEKIKVGSEVIDGHPTDKFKIRIVQNDDAVFEGFIWNAKDLDGMTIRTETENNDFKTVMELKKIVLGRPAPPLFEIPAGYREAKGFLDLMIDQGGPKGGQRR